MKNIKTKIIISLFLTGIIFNVAEASPVPGVSLVVTPAVLEERAGNTFEAAVVVKTPGVKVYAVEGTLAFDGLTCQSITLADGLLAQSMPTCAKPYFLVGIPSGTSGDKNILHLSVKAQHDGSAMIVPSSVDVIGEGLSLSTEAHGATYTISKRATQATLPETKTPTAIIEEVSSNSKGDTAQQTSRFAGTQLATVAGFVADNSVVFSMIFIIAIALGYRYVTNRRKK